MFELYLDLASMYIGDVNHNNGRRQVNNSQVYNAIVTSSMIEDLVKGISVLPPEVTPEIT